MPRQFRVPAGTDYPASLADYKLAKAGKPHKRVPISKASRVTEAPYSEIIGSWLANGVVEVTETEEVSESGVHKR